MVLVNTEMSNVLGFNQSAQWSSLDMSTKMSIGLIYCDSFLTVWMLCFFFFRCSSLEQFKEFDEEPLCVSMHPNGLSILVGFSSEIRLMHLHYDKIRTVQKFPTKNCTEVGRHWCDFNVIKFFVWAKSWFERWDMKVLTLLLSKL